METFEVGIVGAGIHGVSAAFHLARRGIRTAVFDKGAVAGGPTGRSSAICRAYYTNDLLARVAKEALEMFRNFKDLTGGRDCGFRQTGWLYLHPRQDRNAVISNSEKLNRIGTTIRLLSLPEIEREFAVVSVEEVALGAWEDGAGYADPVSTTQGLFQRAIENGLVARQYARVVDIVQRPGGGGLLTLQDDTKIECERVLIAAGPWTANLTRKLGVELPLTVERHVVVTVAWTDAWRMRYGHTDLAGGNYYCKPEGEHLYCVGGMQPAAAVDADQLVETVTAEETESFSRALVRRVPSTHGATVQGGWASLYDVSPDWQPVIGEIADRIYVDAGTSGHGFKLAPAFADLIVGMVLGDINEPELAQFHPNRFAMGREVAAGYASSKMVG